MTSSLRRVARHRIAALVATTGLVLAACSGSGSPSASATAATSPAASMAASQGAATGTVELAVAQDATLGAHLTGAHGMTLYLLTKDAANKTTCTGACAKTWPPFEVDAGQTPSAGAGVSGTIATLTRADDGKAQVTYNGIPLYYYSGDAAPADVNGQGFNGVWFLVAPGSTAASGTITGGVGESGAATPAPSAAAPASPKPSATPAGGGY